MLSKEFINLINSGEALALVGSGLSVDAGLPNWEELFINIADALQGYDVENARKLASKGRLPEAFDSLVKSSSREIIYNLVIEQMNRINLPGQLHKLIAEWPFRMFVTTNYDALLEKASRANYKLTSLGNRPSEIIALTPGMKNLVWHIHGASNLDSQKSDIVISKSDYDNIYPDSNLVQTLKALTRTMQCVYFGFGFNDRDLIHVLKTVGRLGNSGKPNYAFLGYKENNKESEQHIAQLRDEYNIEVIPYYLKGKDGVSHVQLKKLVEAYSPFILRGSVSYGASNGTPEYNPAATSLRVQSGIDLSQIEKTEGLHYALIEIKILSIIREKPGLTIKEVVDSLKILKVNEDDVKSHILNLQKQGIVTSDLKFNLTQDYKIKTEIASAKIMIFERAFTDSVLSRIKTSFPEAGQEDYTRLESIVSRFLSKLCQKSGLGVAQNLAMRNGDQVALRNVALLNDLPSELKFCKNREEALVVVKVTSEILSAPLDSEANYLGILCQCFFGQNLLNATTDLSEIDLNFIKGTCYILDATNLVCAIAEGCENRDFFLKLIRKLGESCAKLATTDYFVQEVLEHANWALKLVEEFGPDSSEVLDALRCKNGYRPNQFLQGYFIGGAKELTFSAYLSSIFKVPEFCTNYAI